MKYLIEGYIALSYIVHFLLLKYCEWWLDFPGIRQEENMHVGKALIFLISPIYFPIIAFLHGLLLFAEVFK